MASPIRPRALITGASAGIGLEYADQLAERGYDLVMVARRRDLLDQHAARLAKQHGITAEVLQADLTTKAGLTATEARLTADPAVTLLINNAGFGGYRPFATIDPGMIDGLIDIHIRAVTQLTRAALPAMLERKSGAIINIASLLSLSGTLPPNPLPHRAVYAGAKAYMLAFTQALTAEIAGSGVYLQLCLPGRIDTQFQSIQGFDTSHMPPAMSAPDMVAASLAGMDLGETVCVPALEDTALLATLTEAQLAVLRTANGKTATAERYRG